MSQNLIGAEFFQRDPQTVARNLLGKVLRTRHGNQWLAARIVETEAYYISEKGSHASLGRTPSRAALFMPAGTIYMYYSRGGDSLNFSCMGAGNAVLVKSGIPWPEACQPPNALETMFANNPIANTGKRRSEHRLCAGQTLLCRALGLRVPDWNQRQLDARRFQLVDAGFNVSEIIQALRLGIPQHRDPHLPYRYIDAQYRHACTKDPTRVRGAREGQDFWIERTTST